jgi:hypothetical protein
MVIMSNIFKVGRIFTLISSSQKEKYDDDNKYNNNNNNNNNLYLKFQAVKILTELGFDPMTSLTSPAHYPMS